MKRVVNFLASSLASGVILCAAPPTRAEVLLAAVKETPAKAGDKKDAAKQENKADAKAEKPADKNADKNADKQADKNAAKPAEDQKKKPQQDVIEDVAGAVEVLVDAAVAIDGEVVVMQEDGAGADNWAAMRKQFLQQFRPILNGQLHLARVICQPTAEQFEQLKIDGEKVLREATKKCVECQKKMQQGGFNFGRDPYPDPNSDIAKGVAAAVKQRLSADKAAKFQEECDKRSAHVKRVAVLNLVSKMDRDLVLSREQREQLANVLVENWKEEWGRNLQMYLQDDYNQYPALPEAPIAAALTPSQAKVWKALPKHNVMYWGWGGFMGGAGMIDVGPIPKVDDPDEEQPKKNGQAKAKDKDKGLADPAQPRAVRAVRAVIGAAVQAVPAAKADEAKPAKEDAAKKQDAAEAKPAETKPAGAKPEEKAAKAQDNAKPAESAKP